MARAMLPVDLVVPAPRLTGDALLSAQRELLEGIDADEREMARLYARTMSHRAEIADLWGGARPGKGLMELAGTARIGQDKATRQMVDGLRLRECFPRALQLLGEGRLHVGTAQLLLSVTKNLSAELQARVGDRVIERIVGLDAADARQEIVTAIAEVVDAEQARAAHERARAQRGVWVKPVEDGMARIGAEVDQLSAHRFALDLEVLDRAAKLADARAGRVRTTQQRRADLLAELPSRTIALIQAIQQGRADQLLGKAKEQWQAMVPATATPDAVPVAEATAPEAGTPGVEAGGPDDLLAALLSMPVRNPTTMHVHIPVTTALDLDHRSGFVEGLGVIPAYQARLLRPVASLARLWVDARTAVPLGLDPDPVPPPEPDLDAEQTAARVRERLLAMLRPTAIRDEAEPRHDPSPRLRRLVQVRDVRCDGPGCAMPARACELDHEQDWAHGGVTAVWNLKTRSPRCHHGKHDGWTVERHSDGSSTWTSPTGRRYRRRGPWRPLVIPDLPLPEPRPDTLDDTDPREDWQLPLWRGEEPPPF